MVILVIRGVFAIDDKCLTLTIEYVNFVVLVVIKGLIGEVPLARANRLLADFANHLFLLDVPYEVAMGQSCVVEDAHKNSVIIYETASCVGVWKRVDAHGVVVKTRYLVDVHLISLDFGFSSSGPAETAQIKDTVVVVNNRKTKA